MNSLSQQSPLSADERQVLRSFISAHQRPLWKDWCDFGLLVLLVVALFAGSQFVGRWVPGHWEAQGFVICSRHQTPHHGTLYFPDGPEFAGLFRLPAAIGVYLSFFFAALVLVYIMRVLHARRIAKLLQRILPETEVA